MIFVQCVTTDTKQNERSFDATAVGSFQLNFFRQFHDDLIVVFLGEKETGQP